MNENDRHEAFEATAQGELYREVVDIYAEPENFPREEASPFAERILQLIDKAVAARDAEIREALLSDEVVEAALDAAEAANDLYPLDGEPSSVWEARYFSATFAAFFEQLLGPRPTEQEAER